MTLRDGHWYRSRAALAAARALTLTAAPHATPDGCAVLVLDLRGKVTVPGTGDAPSTVVEHPPALVMQADHGHDLLQVVGGDRIARVEFPVDALADLEPLVEYDHLPESRKDYTVYPRGHRLA